MGPHKDSTDPLSEGKRGLVAIGPGWPMGPTSGEMHGRYFVHPGFLGEDKVEFKAIYWFMRSKRNSQFIVYSYLFLPWPKENMEQFIAEVMRNEQLDVGRIMETYKSEV